MQPIQLQRGRLAGPSPASSAEVCHHRLTGVGARRLGSLLRQRPSLAAVATVQMDTALRRLEMRLCSRCHYYGAHFSEEAAFRYLGLCQVLIIQKILNLSISLKISVPFTFLCQAPNTALGVGAPYLADGFLGSCVAFVLKYINLL